MPSASWVVDPKDPGPSLPPEGRSLFDFLLASGPDGGATGPVPFPFEALVARIGGTLERTGGGPGLSLLLIPRGRSLQRDAARPEFFRYPRALVAVEGEPHAGAGRSGVLLKDRLYLGYQENANLVEVISYNEAAGRFEFQIVRDYRPGGRREVLYADRGLCVSCHQNAAPIFARPLWDETNGNAGIAGLLAAERRSFYGFPLEPGVDVPYVVDNATDRANLLSAWQLLWQAGCGAADEEAVRCRAALLAAALQYRLNGARRFDDRGAAYREMLLSTLQRRARAQWPGGWRVPSADLPNRNPSLESRRGAAATAAAAAPAELDRGARLALAELVRLSEVPSQFEPLLPRGPLAIWPPPGTDAAGLARAVAGLSEFFAAADLRRLDRHLVRRAHPDAARSRHVAACRFETGSAAAAGRRVSFVCAAARRTDAGEGTFALTGRVYLDGRRVRRGSVDAVSLDGADELPELRIEGGVLEDAGGAHKLRLNMVQAATGLHPRCASGARVEALELSWPRAPGAESAAAGEGGGVLRTVDDFGPVVEGIAALARRTLAGESDVLAAKPLRRAGVLRRLEAEIGLPALEWCCDDASGLPAPRLDAHPADANGTAPKAAGASPERLFLRYCARCHETGDRFPANFLHGSAQQVRANLEQCAERIYFRLAMWQKDVGLRAKTPMPPENALQGLAVSREEWPAHPDLQALRAHVARLLEQQTGAVPSLETLEAGGYVNLRACLPDARTASVNGRPVGARP